jgi:hypothetical protein
MICSCGMGLSIDTQVEPGKVTERADCPQCGRLWIAVQPGPERPPKHQLPLGTRHPRPKETPP